MICSNCSTLSFQSLHKKCKNCKGNVFTNIAEICDTCSSKELICSICLKKIITNKINSGCKSCRKKS